MTHSKPLTLPTKYVKWFITPPPNSLHKLVLTENGYISIYFEVEMFDKCPKRRISCNFGQFWDHMTPSKPLTLPTKYVK